MAKELRGKGDYLRVNSIDKELKTPYSDFMKLDGSVVVVTGSAQRLGRAMLLALVEQGASVVVHYNQNREAALNLVDSLQGSAIAIGADLTTLGGIEELIVLTLRHYGRWDGLVNNASVFDRIPIDEVDYHQWDYQFALHARAPFFLSKGLYEHRKRGEYPSSGWVINISDTGVGHPSPSRPLYYASKGALEGQTRVLATALAPYVRVNGIAPGAVMAASDSDLDYFERLKERLPLKHLASVEEVVATLLFLATNNSITGETIVVDGGEHLLN